MRCHTWMYLMFVKIKFCSRQRVAGHRPTASTGTIYNCLGADMVRHGTTGWCGWVTKRGIKPGNVWRLNSMHWFQALRLRLSSCSLGVIRCVCVCASSYFFHPQCDCCFLQCDFCWAPHFQWLEQATTVVWWPMGKLVQGTVPSGLSAFPQVFGLNFPSWGRLTQCMETGRARISAVCCPVLLKALFGRGWTGQNWCI